MQKFPGFFTFYWDAKAGKIWLEIDKWNTEFLYVESLPAGIGSNDIGLDRGQLGNSSIVRFDRSGPRVLLVAPNYSFRATSNNPDERLAVRDAFAESTLWGFEVAAEEGNRVLVDATNFYLRDVHQVTNTLATRTAGHLSTRCHAQRVLSSKHEKLSAKHRSRNHADFHRRTRGAIRASKSCQCPKRSRFANATRSCNCRPPGFKPRVFDPRAGYFGIDYMDFATPIEEPITKRFIARHRLQKKDPNARVSEAVEPIVYYVDRGAPEPVRSALLEGARWWNQAFEAIGYKDAFRVEMMPPEVDPMDVRYNVIQWVHRSTRGWSYGNSLVDPRTGEIIQGRVSLGSLRDRQDFLIAEGLLAPYDKTNTASPKLLEMVLARLRQLSAHEVGHTLGIATQLRGESGKPRVGDGLSRAASEARRGWRSRSCRMLMRRGSASGTKSRSLTAIRIFLRALTKQPALDRTLERSVRARPDVLDRSGCACRRVARVRWPISGTTARMRSTNWRT